MPCETGGLSPLGLWELQGEPAALLWAGVSQEATLCPGWCPPIAPAPRLLRSWLSLHLWSVFSTVGVELAAWGHLLSWQSSHTSRVSPCAPALSSPGTFVPQEGVTAVRWMVLCVYGMHCLRGGCMPGARGHWEAKSPSDDHRASPGEARSCSL